MKGPSGRLRARRSPAADNPTVIEVPADAAEQIVSDLQFYSDYALTITAFNSKGESPHSKESSFSTPEGGKSSSLSLINICECINQCVCDDLNSCFPESSTWTSVIPALRQPVWERDHPAVGNTTQTQWRDQRIPAAVPGGWGHTHTQHNTRTLQLQDYLNPPVVYNSVYTVWVKKSRLH